MICKWNEIRQLLLKISMSLFVSYVNVSCFERVIIFLRTFVFFLTFSRLFFFVFLWRDTQRVSWKKSSLRLEYQLFSSLSGPWRSNYFCLEFTKEIPTKIIALSHISEKKTKTERERERSVEKRIRENKRTRKSIIIMH